MAKDDIIELTGSVEEVLPGSMFRVKWKTCQILCFATWVAS